MKLKLIHILFFVAFLASCEKEDDITYRFNNEDYKFIPTIYETKDFFTFTNRLNETVTISVKNYQLIVEEAGGYSFANGYIDLFTYERILIDLEINYGNAGQCANKSIEFWKLYNENVRFFFKTAFKPAPCNGTIREVLESPFLVQSITLNNKTYDKTTILFKYTENGAFFHPDYSIDKVYFDFKEGIIGFDDSAADIQFRLIE